MTKYPETEVEPRYLTLNTAAQYLGVTPKALRHYVQRRIVPFCRVERRLLFDRQALDRWLARRSVRVEQRRDVPP
jgi:excisionase family DNA binding protein